MSYFFESNSKNFLYLFLIGLGFLGYYFTTEIAHNPKSDLFNIEGTVQNVILTDNNTKITINDGEKDIAIYFARPMNSIKPLDYINVLTDGIFWGERAEEIRGITFKRISSPTPLEIDYNIQNFTTDQSLTTENDNLVHVKSFDNLDDLKSFIKTDDLENFLWSKYYVVYGNFKKDSNISLNNIFKIDNIFYLDITIETNNNNDNLFQGIIINIDEALSELKTATTIINN